MVLASALEKVIQISCSFLFSLKNVEDLVNENALLREQIEIMKEARVC